MGFSLTGARVMFFITTIIAASAVSGVFIAVTSETSNSLVGRTDKIEDQLGTDFIIVNDPYHIPLTDDGNNRIFYLKNIGEVKIITTNETFQLFLDGDLIETANYNFSDSSIMPGKTTILYIKSSEIGYGDYLLRVVGPLALYDEFTFSI